MDQADFILAEQSGIGWGRQWYSMLEAADNAELKGRHAEAIGLLNRAFKGLFQRQTVQHIKKSGQTVAEVARELKINDNTVYGWVKKFGTDSEVIAAQVFKSDEHQVRELQKRIRELQEENEILKKAMHYFAKDRR